MVNHLCGVTEAAQNLGMQLVGQQISSGMLSMLRSKFEL